MGFAYRGLGRTDDVLEAYGRARDIFKELGAKPQWALVESDIGLMHQWRGDHAAALACLDRAREIGASTWNPMTHAGSAINRANSYRDLGRYAEAIKLYNEGLEFLKQQPYPQWQANALQGLAGVHLKRGELAESLEFMERAVALAGGTSNPASAFLRVSMARVKFAQGDVLAGLELVEGARAVAESVNNVPLLLDAHIGIGSGCALLADHERALEHFERALALAEQTNLAPRVAECLQLIANLYQERGQYARALAYVERALALLQKNKLDRQIPTVLNSIGSLHARIGEFPRALKFMSRALEMEKTRESDALAGMYINLGLIYEGLSRVEEARAHLEKGVELAEKRGLVAWRLNGIQGLGMLYVESDPEKAREYFEQLAAGHREQNDVRGLASAEALLANLDAEAGRTEAAIAKYEAALQRCADAGLVQIEAALLSELTGVYLGVGRHADVLRTARGVLDRLPFLVRGLSEERGAFASQGYTRVVPSGVRAAMALGDLGQCVYFVERGRASALMEALGGRKAIASATIPARVLEQERAARVAMGKARADLQRAVETRKRKQIRTARAALRKSEADLQEAVRRVQRTAKLAADVAYPVPASLEEIRGALTEHQAYVAYALVGEEEYAALVVTQDGARMVSLGRIEAVPAFDDPNEPVDVKALRKVVLDPLKLEKNVRQVLVSPAGVLSYVPFAALSPEHEFVAVPSATSYRTLQSESKRRGVKVLAIGDPSYTKLTRIPGTRAEVNAVGDMILLDDDATVSRFRRKLRAQSHWKSVHLACHGLVDAERPLLSSLALTGGSLKVADVYRMKIPSDLVVLSACETAQGRIYKAEGVMGFTRAFMLAGSPRVIVSLWKVDDEATRALMMAFYEFWKTESTATALRKAQAAVASREDWAHPFYWAAWQLWGLPD